MPWRHHSQTLFNIQRVKQYGSYATEHARDGKKLMR